MNLVFMNRMERKLGDQLQPGCVSIGEEHGTWHVVWEETRADGTFESSCWYEGEQWDDMLVAFRLGVQIKKREGFVPWIQDAWGESNPTNRGQRVPALQFYAEQHRNEELFEELRQWRRAQANQEGKTSYFIATNRLLEMICAYVPHTAEELKQIPGMSANKIAAYSKEWLALTQNHVQPSAFPLDWVEASVDPLALAHWQNGLREARTRMAVQKLEAKRKLLEGIAEGLRLDELEQRLSVPRKDVLTWLEELDREGYDVEPFIALELADMPEADCHTAEEVMRKEGIRYLKPIYNKVYGKEKLSAADVNAAYERIRLLRIRFRQSNGTALGEERDEAVASANGNSEANTNDDCLQVG